MSLSRKFTSLLVVGLVTLVLMVYLMTLFGRPSAGLEKGLKLIHKGHHADLQSADTTVHTAISTAPPTTPAQPNLLAEHVRKTCESLKLGKPGAGVVNPDRSRYDHILVDDRYKMLYCYVPKVACTNWRRIMLVLSGKVKVSNVLQITGGDVHGRYKRLLPRLSDMSKAEIQHRLDNYFKFMFVREPFERLLSAWRNKFQNSANPYFRKQFEKTILRRFRESGEMKDSKTGVLFEEFLQYLVDPLRKEALNEHWATYYRLCLPCSVNYDFVGRYENIEQDALHVLKAVHADHRVRFPERLASYKYNETSAYLSRFYRNLSAPLLRHVYKIYRKDFLLFRYSLPEELQWVFREESPENGN